MFGATWILSFTFGVVVYLLPTIVAALRRKQAMTPILVLNILGGWSVIGWIIALAWAFAPEKQS